MSLGAYGEIALSTALEYVKLRLEQYSFGGSQDASEVLHAAVLWYASRRPSVCSTVTPRRLPRSLVDSYKDMSSGDRKVHVLALKEHDHLEKMLFCVI
jgi:hypothetical protein